MNDCQTLDVIFEQLALSSPPGNSVKNQDVADRIAVSRRDFRIEPAHPHLNSDIVRNQFASIDQAEDQFSVVAFRIQISKNRSCRDVKHARHRAQQRPLSPFSDARHAKHQHGGNFCRSIFGKRERSVLIAGQILARLIHSWALQAVQHSSPFEAAF